MDGSVLSPLLALCLCFSVAYMFTGTMFAWLRSVYIWASFIDYPLLTTQLLTTIWLLTTFSLQALKAVIFTSHTYRPVEQNIMMD